MDADDMLTPDASPSSINATAPITDTIPNILIKPSIASPIFPGTFAARHLSEGTLILTDEVLLDGIDYRDRAAFYNKYSKLSKDEKQLFANFSPPGNRDPWVTYQVRVRHYDNPHKTSGIFPRTAHVTHSSWPNAYFAWNATIGRGTIYAIREIATGEEISISYCDPLLSFAEQMKKLARYPFSTAFDQANEERLSEIRRLKSQIKWPCITSPEEFDDLQMAILRLDLDFLWSLDLADLYRRAAAWSDREKDHKQAVIFAQKGLNVVRVCVGSNSEHYTKMEEFVLLVEEARLGALRPIW